MGVLLVFKPAPVAVDHGSCHRFLVSVRSQRAFSITVSLYHGLTTCSMTTVVSALFPGRHRSFMPLSYGHTPLGGLTVPSFQLAPGWISNDAILTPVFDISAVAWFRSRA